MEKILLFQVDGADADKIRDILGIMRIKMQLVPKEHFKRTLEDLLENGADTEAEPFTGEGPIGSLILMCGLEGKRMDQLLAALRKRQIRSDYKAALTPTNRKWNVLRLYAEMAREKEELAKMGY